MTIVIHVEGASPEDLARAVAAALAVFDEAGVTPWQAAEGVHALERWDISGFDPAFKASEAEIAAAKAWIEAEHAALVACCHDRIVIPFGAHMEVTRPVP